MWAFVKNDSEQGLQVNEGSVWFKGMAGLVVNSDGVCTQESAIRRIEREYLEPDKQIIKPLGSYQLLERGRNRDRMGDLTISFKITGKFSKMAKNGYVQGDPSGWLQPPVDLGLGSCDSWWAATVATNCPTAQARWRN